MQINRTGIFLLALFGLGGLGMVVVPPLVGAPGEVAAILALIGAIWLLVALGFIWFFRRQGKLAAHGDWVFQNGIRGTATVVSASSFITVNEMPVMKLRLALDAPGVAAAEIERRETMPVFCARRMQPGLQLPVYVNPGDHADLVLVW